MPYGLGEYGPQIQQYMQQRAGVRPQPDRSWLPIPGQGAQRPYGPQMGIPGKEKPRPIIGRPQRQFQPRPNALQDSMARYGQFRQQAQSQYSNPYEDLMFRFAAQQNPGMFP